ncbi:prealbumin-like fold domain-containing protein [Exiguobacterium sp. BMC-KP]|uniref:prealbumin-like fold domain-containing protein n=1 Tax=Exiguobacterium sp. BMC-KP TaxID=1684312 RepID=UPI001364D83B
MFSRLLYGAYTLREISAPPGYLIDKADKAITVSQLESSASITKKKFDKTSR